jgi:hypothetical protein
MTAGPVVPRGTQLSAMQTRPLAQSAVLPHDSPSALSTGAGDPLLLLQEPTAATKATPPASEAMDDRRDLGRVFKWQWPSYQSVRCAVELSGRRFSAAPRLESRSRAVVSKRVP